MEKYLVIIFVVCCWGVVRAQEGVFFSDVAAKVAEIPASFTPAEKPSGATTVTISADMADIVAPVSPYVFGNNANVYMTQMVDQPALLDHIRALSPNVIRYPGGNLSSVFFWNAPPGQPPADAPSALVDAGGSNIDPGYWYGKNNQSWTLSVDNYYNMLEATGSTGILTVNYGYARYSTADDPVASAAHLAAEWVRYDNGRTKFWEIGNESNGAWQAGYRIDAAANKDGQPEVVTGELYAKHFLVFADSMRKAAAGLNHTIYIGAQLLGEAPAPWWNATDRHWNEGVFKHAAAVADFFIVHNYFTPYQTDSPPDDILNSASVITERMATYLRSLMAQAGAEEKPLALTEWNIFAEGSQQQVSFINGMHAAMVVGELITHRYGLACRWNLANGWNNGNDHGMFSQGDEPGVGKWNPRPAFHYLYYFQKYFGDHLVAATSSDGDVRAYASKFNSGQGALVLINKGTSPHTAAIELRNYGFGERFYWHTLTGGTDNSPFSRKVFVNGTGPALAAGGPDVDAVVPMGSDVRGRIKLSLPPRSVTYILFEAGDGAVTAVEELADLDVYPNPATGSLMVRFPSTGFHKVELIDINGVRCHAQTVDPEAEEIELRLSLPAGLYRLLLYKGKDIGSRNIIIR